MSQSHYSYSYTNMDPYGSYNWFTVQWLVRIHMSYYVTLILHILVTGILVVEHLDKCQFRQADGNTLEDLASFYNHQAARQPMSLLPNTVGREDHCFTGDWRDAFWEAQHAFKWVMSDVLRDGLMSFAPMPLSRRMQGMSHQPLSTFFLPEDLMDKCWIPSNLCCICTASLWVWMSTTVKVFVRWALMEQIQVLLRIPMCCCHLWRSLWMEATTFLRWWLCSRYAYCWLVGI